MEAVSGRLQMRVPIDGVRMNSNRAGKATQGVWLLALAVVPCLVLNRAAAAEYRHAQKQQTDTSVEVPLLNHVVSRIPQGSAQTAKPWSDRPIATIGVLDGDDDQIFGRIGTVKADRHGNIIILDALSLDVRVFNVKGTMLARAGGSGSGPGKFRTVFDAYIDDDNEISIIDGPLHRITTLKWDSDRLTLAGTRSIDRFGFQLCPLNDGFLVLYGSRSDRGVLHVVDGNGRTRRSFGEVLSGVPEEVKALGGESPATQNLGILYCDRAARKNYLLVTELPYLRAFAGDGQELWRTRLTDFHSYVWRVWQPGERPVFAQTPDAHAGSADGGSGLFRWSRDTLAIAIKRHVLSPDKWQYQLRLISDRDGREIAKLDAPMIITSANDRYFYGYINAPFPKAMIYERRPWSPKGKR